MRLLCLKNGVFYIILVEDCVKYKGWSEKESDNPPDKFWEGEIDNKLPNGFGTYTHTNGTTYVGQYVDDLREGQGTWTLFDGSKFVGICKDNRRW